MKRLITLSIIALMGCIVNLAQPVKFVIKGELPIENNGRIVILKHSYNQTVIDSVIIQNGIFTLKGEVAKPEVALLTLVTGEEFPKTIAIALENGVAKVTFVNANLHAEGGHYNTLLNSFVDYIRIDSTTIQRNKLLAAELQDSTTTEARKKEIQQTFTRMYGKIIIAERDFVKKNTNNLVGAYFFATNSQFFTKQEKDSIMAVAGPEFLADPHIQKVINDKKQADEKKQRELSMRAPGTHYKDFAMADTTGAERRLSDYIARNKVVMVDFWASWCGPCRAEMPYAKEAYARFHDKGFDIVGVSLDSNKEAWLKAIGQLELPWHHLSDLKAWKNEAAARYGVSTIPCAVLIDSTGTIVAADLRGEALSAKLEELLKP